MIVLRSTYDRLHRQHLRLRVQFSALQAKWNNLVGEINAKGGRDFLDRADSRLTPKDIKRLLMLCHPDKHGGKQMAHEMTQKLLSLR